MGLADRADNRVQTFSGGMKRRLNLGAALVHGPDFLLLTSRPPVSTRNREIISSRPFAASMLPARPSCIRATTWRKWNRYARESAFSTGAGSSRATRCRAPSQLDGVIRFRVPQVPPALRDRLKQIPGCRLSESAAPVLELECRDVTSALFRVVAILNEMQLELISLETHEPNLERVFLHLTGRALRDQTHDRHPGEKRFAIVVSGSSRHRHPDGDAAHLHSRLGAIAR